MFSPESAALAERLVGGSYVKQGVQALARRQGLLKSLLSQRRLPEAGWDEASIEMLLREASAMDSNNFLDNAGVGEREARVACPLVARRHWGLAHGIGRSGDIAADQPKAAGSSLLARLCNLLTADAMRRAGLVDMGAVSVLPLATGMALTLSLLALKAARPPGALCVVWPRMDQKTCAKAVLAAGLRLVPVALSLEADADAPHADLGAIEAAIESCGGADSVLCILSTTSCFAPRAPDDVVGIAKLAARLGVGHVINNAYGVQAAPLCASIVSAWRKGRVDVVVQSTDKNFMVPVGGSVVAAGPQGGTLIEAINKLYPGRACASPLLDLLATLLHWGARGWDAVRADRAHMYALLQHKLAAVAAKHGERLLTSPHNPISIAMSLGRLETDLAAAGAAAAEAAAASSSSGGEGGASGAVGAAGGVRGGTPRRPSPGPPPITFLGSMLFARCVSGTRVVPRGAVQTVGPHRFVGYGSSVEGYPCAYLTAAAALGTTAADVDMFVSRLDACLVELRRKHLRPPAPSAGPSAVAHAPDGEGEREEGEDGSAAAAFAHQAAHRPSLEDLKYLG